MRRSLILLATMLALLAACGGDSEPAGDEAETTAPPTTSAPTVQADVSTTTEVMPTEMTKGLIYHPGGDPFSTKSGAVDVIAPIEGGPWPTVVVFHGDPRVAGKSWHRPDAQLIAEQGRVVFLPAWGHFDPLAIDDMGAEASWDLTVRELKCAVAFAHNHTEEFGGDPDHITLYGLSAGGNAVLMAGFADEEPLDTCSTPGPAGAVQALVPIDADWVMGGSRDTELTANPEAFYSITPWRLLDGSQDLSIDVTVAENTGAYTRSVEPDPTASWLSYRHPDINLVADLDARGFLTDGEFSLKESSEYAVEILSDSGYNVTLVVLPGATHESWGQEGRRVVVETVLNAER
jgi:acetyl esterase/lipase